MLDANGMKRRSESCYLGQDRKEIHWEIQITPITTNSKVFVSLVVAMILVGVIMLVLIGRQRSFVSTAIAGLDISVSEYQLYSISE